MITILLSTLVASLPLKDSFDQNAPTFFYPPSEVVVVNTGRKARPLFMKPFKHSLMAKNHLLKQFDLTDADLKVSNQFVDTAGVAHIYADRMVNGVKVLNQNAAVYIYPINIRYM